VIYVFADDTYLHGAPRAALSALTELKESSLELCDITYNAKGRLCSPDGSHDFSDWWDVAVRWTRRAGAQLASGGLRHRRGGAGLVCGLRAGHDHLL